MELIKKIPWWGRVGLAVAIAVAIFLIWQSLSGWATSRNLYNMMLDQIQTDKDTMIKDQKEWIKICEDEIMKLGKEKEEIQKEKIIWERKGIESAKEVTRLKENNNVLKKKLQNIVISGDPDKLIDGLNKRGLSSIRRCRSRPN